jgi:selenide, water dikinase
MDDVGSGNVVPMEIVLVGGGHAHVHVLKALARLRGARVSLISRNPVTLYSGMLPGVIAGLYTVERAQIDLQRLCAATATRLIHAEAVGLDRTTRRVLLAGQPAVTYDLASLDVGIAPDLAPIAGAAEHAIAVKPIGAFLDKFAHLCARCRRPDGPRHIVVVGGGAGGVEVLLSLRARLMADAANAGPAGSFSFALVTDGELLATHNPQVRRTFRRIFAERRIALHERRRVVEVDRHAIVMADGTRLDADVVVVATHAAPPVWFRDSGLALDDRGFVAVTPTLQVLNDPDVFAAGDCATLVATPREKAGVYAVRAGPKLSDNLCRRAGGEALKPWRPQRRHLALISTGERYAVASRGPLKAEGAWLWTLKDWIDRRWMRMYQESGA